MHYLDADVVERGDNKMTAAYWYGVPFAPLKIDIRLSGDEERLTFGQYEIVCSIRQATHPVQFQSIWTSPAEDTFWSGHPWSFLAEFGSDIGLWQHQWKNFLT